MLCSVEHHFYRVVLLAVAGLDDEVEFHPCLVKIVHQVHLGDRGLWCIARLFSVRWSRHLLPVCQEEIPVLAAPGWWSS